MTEITKTNRNREIVRLHDKACMSFRDIGKKFGISYSRVRYIYDRALRLKKETDETYISSMFYKALIEACEKQGLDLRNATRAFNCLRLDGALNDISKERGFLDWSDYDLLKIYMFGQTSLDLVRQADVIFRNM